jgi:hypothetical protein
MKCVDMSFDSCTGECESDAKCALTKLEEVKMADE